MNSLFFQSLFLGALFFLAGINKTKGFTPTADGLMNKINIKFLPKVFFKLVILIVIIVEILFPLINIAGSVGLVSVHLMKLATIGLICFTVLATMLYHSPLEKGQIMPFLKNLSIIGGLWSFYSLL